MSSFFSLVLAGLWIFPLQWYTRTNPDKQYFWLAEQTQVAGWDYRVIPVAESAEAVLVADRLVNGEFQRPETQPVRVFSAKRYEEKQNEIGLFVHTPDRCWTQAGWNLEPAAPDVVELEVHGIRIRFERRIFVFRGQRELVYFCGLTGGQPLPYRLDHNLSVGMKYQLGTAADKTGTTLRGTDERLWTRVWESFRSRRPLLGPKQFLRISTPVATGEEAAGDQLLADFLADWLTPVDFEEELATWHKHQPEEPAS